MILALVEFVAGSQRDKGRHSGPETALVYTTAGPIRQGSPPAKPLDPGASKVRIRLDRRASDRVVTVVSGVVGGALRPKK